MAEVGKFEKEIDLKKEQKRKKKKERKQEQLLNNVSEARWKRLGSVASWVGYRVTEGDRSEVVPIKRGTSRIKLVNITSNLKRVIRKEKEQELAAKKRKRRLRRKNSRNQTINQR
jgi:hypothetical protein